MLLDWIQAQLLFVSQCDWHQEFQPCHHQYQTVCRNYLLPQQSVPLIVTNISRFLTVMHNGCLRRGHSCQARTRRLQEWTPLRIPRVVRPYLGDTLYLQGFKRVSVMSPSKKNYVANLQMFDDLKSARVYTASGRRRDCRVTAHKLMPLGI